MKRSLFVPCIAQNGKSRNAPHPPALYGQDPPTMHSGLPNGTNSGDGDSWKPSGLWIGGLPHMHEISVGKEGRQSRAFRSRRADLRFGPSGRGSIG